MKLLKHIFLLSFICSCASVFAQLKDLDRVEPSSWWVGMRNQNLQLLVRGNKIAERTVTINYPGVSILKVNKTDNPNYLFLDLEISSKTLAGNFDIVFSKLKSKDIKYTYTIKNRVYSDLRIQGISNKDLLYLLMPDRFSNGDKTNDVVVTMKENTINRAEMYARHGGDIQGIINHLDYIKDLGITAIWCTPEIENDMPQASYHGYAATDHYKIDPRFGTNELYAKYVDAAHQKGLKVIKDVVHNHIGLEHWMMKDKPSKDWVHVWDEFTQTSYKDQPMMDPYVAEADRKKTVDGWFVASMPDLNQYNAYVRNYIIQNHIWWVEYAGIDGIRIDTYLYNDANFMAEWAKRLKIEYPRLGVFGETLVNSVISQAYFTENTPLRKDFNTYLPGITDAVLKDAIYEAVNGNFGWMEGASKLYSVLSTDIAYKDPSKNVVFLDNHDMSRVFSCVGEDVTKLKSAISILLTTRGIPQMYYGTELLMKNFSDPDGKVRSDMMGGWEKDSTNKFLATGRTEKENDFFNFYKILANYRKNTPALYDGKLTQYVPEDGIYVYFRYTDDKTIMVVFNGNNKSIELNTKRFKEHIKDFTKGENIISKEIIDIQKINIPNKTTLILELKK
jgi:neopullulanase